MVPHTVSPPLAPPLSDLPDAAMWSASQPPGPLPSAAGLDHSSPRHASHVTPPVWESCKVLQGDDGGQGPTPTRGSGRVGRGEAPGRHRASGWTKVDASCPAWRPARGPGVTPEEARAQGREPLSFFPGMRGEYWDRGASGGLSWGLRQLSPRLLLCCYLGPR